MSSPISALTRTGIVIFEPLPGNTQHGMYNQKQVDIAEVKEKAKKVSSEVFETHILSDKEVAKIVITTFDPSLC